MPGEIDPKVADSLVRTAISSLWALPSEKILCTRRALKAALLDMIQEAYEIGQLAGQEVRLRESTLPGSTGRPSWMDVRLDDQAAMATHHLRLRPMVLRSLFDAGYQCLGDLRWVPMQQLIGLFYIGRKTSQTDQGYCGATGTGGASLELMAPCGTLNRWRCYEATRP